MIIEIQSKECLFIKIAGFGKNLILEAKQVLLRKTFQCTAGVGKSALSVRFVNNVFVDKVGYFFLSFLGWL